jgi:CcmD family protein
MTRLMMLRRAIGIALLVMACVSVAPLTATAQPQNPAQEGFVPIDQLQAKEQLPAAPFLMAAYAVAWLVIFGYVWSLWRRLSNVEGEIAALRKNTASGRRP